MLELAEDVMMKQNIWNKKNGHDSTREKNLSSILHWWNGENTMLGDIMTISRLRMGTDGDGVTTLVTLFGCPYNIDIA